MQDSQKDHLAVPTGTAESRASRHTPVQFGRTASADFEDNTITLEMEPGYTVAVGPVAVLPRGTYDDLIEVARLLSLATDDGDDAAQGTHYADKQGRIRCKGSFLETIEKARRAIANATGAQA